MLAPYCAKAPLVAKHIQANNSDWQRRRTLDFICGSHASTKSSYLSAAREYSKPVSGLSSNADRGCESVFEKTTAYSKRNPQSQSRRKDRAMKSGKLPTSERKFSIAMSL